MKCKECGEEMNLVYTDWGVERREHPDTCNRRYWDDHYRCPVCGSECIVSVNYWLEKFPFDAVAVWKK